MNLLAVTKVSHSLLYYVVRALVLLPLGLLCAGLGLLLLWVNEGIVPRAQLAASATEIAAEAPPSAAPKGLLAVTGSLHAAAGTGDPVFLENDPSLLVVDRHVEMFAWHETVDTYETRHWGGGRTIERHIHYTVAWTPFPQDSTQFHDPTGHENPEMRYVATRTVADPVRVGAWALPALAEHPILPGYQRIFLDSVTVRDGVDAHRHGNTLYLEGADPNAPKVGDLRVTFDGVRAGELVTAFGVAQGDQLVPLESRKTPWFFDVVSGDREAAIEILRAEDELRLLLLRVIGFAMIWLGLFLGGSLSIAFLDIVPLAGTVGRVVFAIITLPATILLTVTTIALSQIGHNPWATAAVLLGMVGLIWIVYTFGPRWQARFPRRKTTDMTTRPRPTNDPPDRTAS
jgi:hypothetical protein